MFTGLITDMGVIAAVKKRSGGALLAVRAEKTASSSGIGDSIAVNGVCLTVVTNERGTLSFDLSDETLTRTNLGTLKPGDRVNLEPALRADSRIGGHFVTGHVDAVGHICSKIRVGDMWKFHIEAPYRLMPYLVEKGSIAVDGVSLTIVDILNETFSFVVIPHTAEKTTLGFKGRGDSVNLEADVLGKYVARLLGKEAETDARIMRNLREGGFLDT